MTLANTVLTKTQLGTLLDMTSGGINNLEHLGMINRSSAMPTYLPRGGVRKLKNGGFPLPDALELRRIKDTPLPPGTNGLVVPRMSQVVLRSPNEFFIDLPNEGVSVAWRDRDIAVAESAELHQTMRSRVQDEVGIPDECILAGKVPAPPAGTADQWESLIITVQGFVVASASIRFAFPDPDNSSMTYYVVQDHDADSSLTGTYCPCKELSYILNGEPIPVS